jgi:uncharacterized damage-inducible protein DinB
MALKDGLLAEFDHEMGATRRLLERVPEADLAWRPHDKSFTLGELAGHLASIPHWVEITIGGASFDLAGDLTGARPPAPSSTAALLERFDANVKKARTKIDEQTDPAFFAPWTLQSDGQELFTMPKNAVLRSFVMNHIVHHRGQLTVYLRLRNVPLPAIYGPTADEG